MLVSMEYRKLVTFLQIGNSQRYLFSAHWSRKLKKKLKMMR